MLTSSPNTSSSSAITSPMWMPMRNCMDRSAGRCSFRSAITICIANRGLDGADDRGKLQQETVAGILHQAAAVIEDDRIDRGAMGLERGVRPRLVGSHHAGIAGDVSTDDGCQASFHVPTISPTAPEWAG
jgi:hypothetical protein